MRGKGVSPAPSSYSAVDLNAHGLEIRASQVLLPHRAEACSCDLRDSATLGRRRIAPAPLSSERDTPDLSLRLQTADDAVGLAGGEYEVPVDESTRHLLDCERGNRLERLDAVGGVPERTSRLAGARAGSWRRCSSAVANARRLRDWPFPSFFRRDSQLLPDLVDEALDVRRGRQDVPLVRWGVGGDCC